MFVYELKKLLDQAMLKLDASTREQLLLHLFLSRLPDTVNWQLRASGEMKTLQTAVDQARLLIALDDPQQTAVVASSTNKVEELKEQITRLTEQVATLVAFPSHCNTDGQQRRRSPLHCFTCNHV